VLFRNAEAIEVMEQVGILAADKTGTLTEGKPELTTVRVAEGFEEAEFLQIVAGLELASEHPLAAAIARGVAERGIRPAAPESFTAIPGQGVIGRVAGREVVLGGERLLAERGISLRQLAHGAASLRAEGKTAIFAAIDGREAGLLGVADRIKESTPEVLSQLREQGVRVVMVTGDSPATANAVASQLGIEEVEAGALPERKGEIVRRLQAEGAVVAYAGDGINDAPALAAANVGIAMGTGTDVAMESAGITLVRGDLQGVVQARRLSRLTVSNIRQNLFFAFIYNTIGVPIAAGVLYPFFGILLSPILAAAAMSLSSVSVIANALRLRRARL